MEVYYGNQSCDYSLVGLKIALLKCYELSDACLTGALSDITINIVHIMRELCDELRFSTMVGMVDDVYIDMGVKIPYELKKCCGSVVKIERPELSHTIRAKMDGLFNMRFIHITNYNIKIYIAYRVLKSGHKSKIMKTITKYFGFKGVKYFGKVVEEYDYNWMRPSDFDKIYDGLCVDNYDSLPLYNKIISAISKNNLSITIDAQPILILKLHKEY
jgi:hypothetical protein